MSAHMMTKKILDNIRLRREQRGFAVKLFYSTLKLLRVWRINVKKFGFPKSTRDLKLTQQ